MSAATVALSHHTPKTSDERLWFLDDLDFASETATFTEVGRARLAKEVFLDRWDRSGHAQRQIGLSTLLSAPTPQRPAVIWHTSFCCSTLLADCLDMPGACLALKEPGSLLKLAEAVWEGRKAADSRLIEAVFSHLAQPFEPGERVVLKPTNSVNTLMPIAADFVGPSLLLYSKCRDYLAAVASGGPVVGGGEMRRGIVRSLLAQRLAEQPSIMKWSAKELARVTDFQAAALLWHVQAAEFRAYLASVGSATVRSLDCDVFLERPTETLSALDGLFDLGLGSAHISEIVHGPKFRRYSKKLDHPFDAKKRRLVFDLVARALGPTLDAITAWSYDVCPETPLDDPIGSPLLAPLQSH